MDSDALGEAEGSNRGLIRRITFQNLRSVHDLGHIWFNCSHGSVLLISELVKQHFGILRHIVDLSLLFRDDYIGQRGLIFAAIHCKYQHSVLLQMRVLCFWLYGLAVEVVLQVVAALIDVTERFGWVFEYLLLGVGMLKVLAIISPHLHCFELVLTRHSLQGLWKVGCLQKWCRRWI